MKLYRLFKAVVAGLACTGILIPAYALEAAEPPVKRQQSKSGILDVRLAKSGVFEAQVFDAKMKPVANVGVSIRKERKEVLRTKTDGRGFFRAHGLKPGIYYVIAGTGHGLYRVWSDRTAPPSARSQIRMISDSTVVRAQGQVLYDEDGTAYGQVRIVDNGGLVPIGPDDYLVNGGGSFLDSLGVYDVVLIGAGVTAITLTAITLNRINDVEDKVDADDNS